jgi:hypothetical protein
MQVVQWRWNPAGAGKLRIANCELRIGNPEKENPPPFGEGFWISGFCTGRLDGRVHSRTGADRENEYGNDYDYDLRLRSVIGHRSSVTGHFCRFTG